MKNHFLANANAELQRARDAVYTILNSGSYICTYDETGKKLLSIRFSDALRKLYGYSNQEDAPDTWEMWVKSIVPEDKKRVLDHYQKALEDKTGNTDYDVTYRALKKDGSIRWHRAAGHILRRSDGTADTCYGFVMDIAQILLEDAGAKITKAENGQKAVNIYAKSKPEEFDVILMDVMMPVMDMKRQGGFVHLIGQMQRRSRS